MSVRNLRRSVSVGPGLMVLMLAGVMLAQTASVQAQTPVPAAPAAAQAVVRTRVHGTVTDPDGELIPGATVTLTSAKGQAITAKSGSDGTYSATVTPGVYGVVVTMPGFATYSADGVNVPAVTSTTLDAKLQVGVQSEVVTVQSDSVQLSVDPDSNQSSVVLTGKDLDALSDDPDELQSELTALAGPSAGPNGGQIYVDGFTGGQLPPKSSIREIRVNQNPFSAQYDMLGYGRIQIFTKPGTDKLHGNLQMNGNPSQFNSDDPLAKGYQPPYHTLFMFGNLTGPFSKNASYNLGGTFRQIQQDEFTNTTILSTAAAPTVLCIPPNLTGCISNPYQVSTYFPQTRADINPRLDLALGSKNVLTTRYQFVKNDATNEGAGNLTLQSAAYNTTSLSNILQISDDENFSSRLINEIRFEYEREHVATTPLSNLPSLNASDFTGGGYSGQSLTDHQDHIEFQNYTSLQLKKNLIHFGGRLRSTREAQSTENNTNGSFNYTSLTYSCVGTVTIDGVVTQCVIPPGGGISTTGQGSSADHSYATGTPSIFSITTVNNHKIGDTDVDLGMYLETDWSVRKNLMVSYGFRYETQNHLPDHHDIAPRVSFNYGLFSGKGAPKTVLRGGFGTFYNRFLQANVLTLEQENGVNETVYTVDDPSTTCAPAATSGTGSAANNLISACGATASAQTTYTAAKNLRSSYMMTFAGGVDQQLGRAATISVNYLHSQGVHQLASQNINYNYNAANPGPANPNIGPQYQYFSEGVFKQNQLIINGRVQTSKAISLFGYYSLNSANGDASGAGGGPRVAVGGFISTPGDIAADYGRTAFDVKNRLFLAGSISLPKFIQFSPFMIAQSGNPYNITTGIDNYKDNIVPFNARPEFGAPNGIPAGTKGTNTIAGCGSFVQPPTGVAYKAIPVNACTGPALFTFNFRLTKTFGFGGSTVANNRRGGGGGAGGGGGGFGGGPGGGPGGGGGGPRGGGGGGGGPRGGGANTSKRYNFGIGLQVQNLFNNEDLATPQGVLNSSEFGKSTQITGGAYTTDSALRRITLQASFTF
jgi:hypothetical protein